jgi:UDP-GlcNAc:undecaprenyl-phosphate GlcNAc-1-phosphate transferase
MFALIPVILSSLLICFVLTPFLRDLFEFLGIVDRPDSYRKTHGRPIPRVGGIGLVIAYFVAFIALALGWWRGLFDPHDPTIRLVVRLSPAVFLVFLIGLCDDLWGLSAWNKLSGQVGAATYAWWVGVRLATPSGYTGPTFIIDVVAILWLVLCANAFNLIDGLDGLATGVALIASVSLLMAAVIHHNPGLALVITPLIGALLGFLFYNFNPASIFLGDSGSLVVGFLLGCYGLMWNQRASTGLGRLAPLVALAFPVFEVGLSIIRRFLRNRPIFGSDKNHIHHKILSLGISHRNAAFVLYGVSALVAVMAVLQTILRPEFATVLLLLLLAVAFLGFRSLRYPELGVLGKFLFAGGMRRTLGTSIYLKDYEESLAQAKTLEDCWLALRNTCREASFNDVSLEVDGRQFAYEPDPGRLGVSRLRIEISPSGFATFGHDPDVPMSAMLIAPLAERLQHKLRGFEFVNGWQDPNGPRDWPKQDGAKIKKAVAR